MCTERQASASASSGMAPEGPHSPSSTRSLTSGGVAHCRSAGGSGRLGDQLGDVHLAAPVAATRSGAAFGGSASDPELYNTASSSGASSDSYGPRFSNHTALSNCLCRRIGSRAIALAGL